MRTLAEIEQDYEETMQTTTDLQQQYKLIELLHELERDYYISPVGFNKNSRVNKLYQRIEFSRRFG